MKFTKMHGLGNDFILITQDHPPEVKVASKMAIQWCNRHQGIGADGLVFLYPTSDADIAMRIFNADGTLAEQCGNAIRCVAKYYYERISKEKETILIETKVGIQPVWLHTENGVVQQIRVDMGVPKLKAAEIPVLIESQGEPVVSQSITIKDMSFQFTGVSMGNPHIVIPVSDAKAFPVQKWGPLLETHSYFPQKTNVEFATYHTPNEITMRVWERGVGETLACGSGACATLVAGVLTGKSDRRAILHLAGGELEIEWNVEDDHVYMTGPAAFVFSGEWIEGLR
ncbi:diaminopimelate epimerase [Hazenella coriacea]|uniref:Diaminopimelate epimerase n=1 Tax=Hazenella coriacea TaxID=1179467 RepID=A0A4R3L5C6_9BACL|nr:diaminopimelate epimerase [Hazenella coriacea]TCS94592.1 diaminopimelate epimerase [Hazenella coriacea]